MCRGWCWWCAALVVVIDPSGRAFPICVGKASVCMHAYDPTNQPTNQLIKNTQPPLPPKTTRPGYNLPTMSLEELAAKEVAEAEAREARAKYVRWGVPGGLELFCYVCVCGCVWMHVGFGVLDGGTNPSPIPPRQPNHTHNPPQQSHKGTPPKARGGMRSSRRTGRRTTRGWWRRQRTTTGRGTIGRTTTRGAWGIRRESGFRCRVGGGMWGFVERKNM